jgi:hypothetical protein
VTLDPTPTAKELRAMAAQRGVLPQNGPVEPPKRTKAPEMPIARLIDQSVTCVTCGAKRGGCDCAERFRPFDIVLPLPPNMANGRMHWRAKDRKRNEYFEACDEWKNSSVVPSPPSRPIAFAELRALLTLWNPMDDDGAMARIKWSLDWLVTRGYLAGDSRKHVRWHSVPDQQIDRKAYGIVLFRIAPQAPAPGGAVLRSSTAGSNAYGDNPNNGESKC